jgi:hypothetical protein
LSQSQPICQPLAPATRNIHPGGRKVMLFSVEICCTMVDNGALEIVLSMTTSCRRIREISCSAVESVWPRGMST